MTSTSASVPATTHPDVVEDDVLLAERLVRSRDDLKGELGRVVVGQEEVIEQTLIALLAGGHCLIVGVPGLAKTLLVSTLARVLDLEYSRIQFTPDLMPSDITGTDIIREDEEGRRHLTFVPGPLFANVVLADEVNRTPPKTQSALLEAMQEHHVTVQGRTYTLDEPFFVFATQNPIELEGTYPLPEAQLDRFMFQIVVDYLSAEDEVAVVRGTTSAVVPSLRRVLGKERLLEYQRLVRRVPVADEVARFAVELVRRTRPGVPGAVESVKKYVSYGASIRAAQNLVLGGKARALLHGRAHVGYDDVRVLAAPVLGHRVLRNFQAQADGVSVGEIIADVVRSMKPPRSGM